MTRSLIFGELLYDVFPDGRAVLGGAPFNVARHLRGLGLDPLMISRVGDDERGRAALDAMRAWGMDTSGVQIDTAHATGEVRVRLKDGQPTFEIVPDRAWDHIDAAAAVSEASATFGIFYHGSLALRSAPSHETFRALTRRDVARRFLDVNLRAPWWKAADVLDLARGAHCVKLNDDEAATLWGDASVETGSRRRAEWDCDAVIITRGERGADVVTSRESLHVDAVRPPVWADAVGAGDAFSAVVIAGLLKRLEWPAILSMAAAFAAKACGVSGALGLPDSAYAEFARSLFATCENAP